MIPTRKSFVDRLRNMDDQVTWQRFYEVYRKLIYGVARQSGLSDSEAQDVVQETVVAVARNISDFTYDASGSFKTWLLNMTRWRIIDHVRKRGRLPCAPSAACEPESGTGVEDKVIDPSSGELDALWEREWQTSLLNAAVDRVKRRVEPQTYQLFDLYVNKEWPAEKVADAFEVPTNVVYIAKHRVTELLKAEVARIEREFV